MSDYPDYDEYVDAMIGTHPVVTQLLGCSWGTTLWTEDDTSQCDERAVKMVAIHGAGDAPVWAKVCGHHLTVLGEHTTPRESACPNCGTPIPTDRPAEGCGYCEHPVRLDDGTIVEVDEEGRRV